MERFKIPVSVLVVIHSPELDILLLERAATPGFWQSVTGSREEEDEPLANTAMREVREETGIEFAADALLDWRLSNRYEIFRTWRRRYRPEVTHNVEHVYSVCVARETPVVTAPGEHLAHVWLPWHEAAQKVFSWSNRDAILMLGQAQESGGIRCKAS